MGIISVSFYKSYFYFLLFWILELSSTLIKEFLDQIYADHKKVNLLFELTNLICINGADLLAGILVIITFIQTKSTKSNESIEKKKKNTIEQELIYNDLSIRRNKYSLLLIISILEFIARYLDFFFFVIFGIKRIRGGEISWLISIDFLSRIFFSSIFLKAKLFRHHIVTIILTILSLCTMSACAFIVIDGVDFGNWPYFFSIGLKFIILPLEDVLNKILFNEKFLLPHSLMFMRGIFNLLIFIIFIPAFIIIKSKHKNDNYFNFKHKEKNVDIILQIFLVFLYIFLYSFRIFCVMKVIYIFSPQHVAFLNEVFYLFLLLRCRIRAKDYLSIIIIDLICLLIIITSTLVFNEMIIINLWGLNKNTKNALLLRESQETIESKSSINEDNESNNNISKSSFEDSFEYHNY